MGGSSTGIRHAGVLGKPIAHSKSPLLHRAAYAALGLSGWTYERIECDADQLPALVSALSADWVGLSVTMPGKFAALEFATERTRRAELVGSANTLVRVDGGWRADCTDIDGVTGSLRELGVTGFVAGPPVVIGAGGTARPALAALAELGAEEVVIVSRDRDRAQGALECAGQAGLAARWIDFAATPLAAACAGASVVISTVPAEAAAPHTESIAGARKLLDVIYDPWPTPLAVAVEGAGGAVVGGLSMLLNQAYGQVEQFTGRPAPRVEMARALD
ncbi:shikimate dehydrogenase [Tomitella biformata]|uniref:shikimate dehydrogenase n=1 Tax=Tomitella biformata TaxID=630403 RepID=UPI000464EEC3|nr:shikimate dehydrogenase [Tomitella biformata]